MLKKRLTVLCSLEIVIVWLYQGDYGCDDATSAQADHITRETRVTRDEVVNVNSTIIVAASKEPGHDGKSGTAHGAGEDCGFV